MQTIFVFDDEYPFVEKITNMLSEHAFNVLCAGNFNDSMKLLDKWVKAQSFPDLYIFDYYVNQNTPENNYTGLDIAKRMLAERDVPSILITGEKYNDEIRRKAKELNIDAKYKLSKEILTTAEGRNDFLDIVFEALSDGYTSSQTEAEKQPLKTIGIKRGLGDDYFFFEYDSLLYLEAKGNSCKIVFTDRESYTFGTNLGEVAPQIRAIHSTFVPAGRSHFVNLNNIIALKSGLVLFKTIINKESEILLRMPAYHRLKEKLMILKTR